MIIQKYVPVEGGDYVDWPADKPKVFNTTEVNRTLSRTYDRCTKTVEIAGVRLHAIITSFNNRWDCINGWTLGFEK